MRAFVDRVTDHLIAVGVESLRRWELQDTGIQITDDVAASWGPFFGPRARARVFLPPLIGGLDNCGILLRGDRAQIRDHVRHLLQAGRGGGFVTGPRSIGTDIPVETME